MVPTWSSWSQWKKTYVLADTLSIRPFSWGLAWHCTFHVTCNPLFRRDREWVLLSRLPLSEVSERRRGLSGFVTNSLELWKASKAPLQLHHFVMTWANPWRPFIPCSAFEVFVNRDIGKARAAWGGNSISRNFFWLQNDKLQSGDLQPSKLSRKMVVEYDNILYIGNDWLSGEMYVPEWGELKPRTPEAWIVTPPFASTPSRHWCLPSAIASWRSQVWVVGSDCCVCGRFDVHIHWSPQESASQMSR